MGKKVLILCPHPERKGGVAHYYRAIKRHFSSDNLTIQYYYTGKKSDNPSLPFRIKHSIKDILSLLTCISKYDMIHLNPSLDMKAIIRDGIYNFIAKRIFRKKTIVFFHGWSSDLENTINNGFIPIFKIIFNCDCILVLADSFKTKLLSWGYDPDKIIVETTNIDDALFQNFSIEDRLARIDSNSPIKLLFLARIEKNKGIMETIEAFSLLAKDYPEMRLVIAGTGSFIHDAKKYADKISKNHITFLGYVRGNEKINVYLTSDIYIFPTYYSEGMPISILEAMAMGLPVVTRPVASIKDFLKNGKHGFLIESKNPVDIVSCINRIINDVDLWKSMASESHEYAIERFPCSRVARRLEGIYNKILAI